jgi:hypothetical protein
MTVKTVQWYLLMNGADWATSGDEGPRRVGECVYCAGPCEGVTTMCESRVFEDAKELDAR